MVPIFAILLLCLPQLLVLGQETDPYTEYSQLNLPPGLSGPDSVARDPSGQGPYVGISDGRILKYNGVQFVDFASISPDRPLGLSFDHQTGDLYVAGAYGGFFKVGPLGGQATLIASGVNGAPPFYFLVGVDVDSARRVAYLMDTSLVYSLRDGAKGVPPNPNDSSGRLIQYNIKTRELKVLLDQLTNPTGPAVSTDGTFVIYGSITGDQVFKYGLAGGTINIVLDKLQGYPVKVKKATDDGFFWVPVNVPVAALAGSVQPQAFGYKFSSTGYIQMVKNFTNEHSEADVVQEYVDYGFLGLFVRRTLYVGSWRVPFVGVYQSSWGLSI